MKFHKYIPYGLRVMSGHKESMSTTWVFGKRVNLKKKKKLKLFSLFWTHPVNMIKPSVKFHRYIPYGVGIISRIEFSALHYMGLRQGDN